MSEQFVLDLARPEPPTFDNFVAGDNREAIAALAALATGESRECGVLLWGAGGAGKSHLLRAAASAARSVRPVVDCVTANSLPQPSDVPASALLVVDGIDLADANAQARLFTLVNELPAAHGQWLAAASGPPARRSRDGCSR